MSSSKGARVSSSSSSIPDSVKSMIQNIREITGAHEDEIYATLKDCAMDPNETAQRLLNQDTFHEVKRKRDKKKENLSNKETVESKWKPGQGRGGRGGCGNYSSRHVSNDTGVKNSSVGKELSASQEPKKNESPAATSSTPVITNGPSAIVAKGAKANISKSGGPSAIVAKGAKANISKSGNEAPHEHLDIKKGNSGTENISGQPTSISATETQVTSPVVQFSSSDPILEPSNGSIIPGAAATIKREVGSKPSHAEKIPVLPSEAENVSASEIRNSSNEAIAVKSKSVEVAKNQQSDGTLRPNSAHSGSSAVRPSSSHSNRSQQAVGPSKVGLTKEWKPKPTNPILPQGYSVTNQSEVSAATEVNTQSRPVTGDINLKESSTKLQKTLEKLHISESQQVIIPNHLHVPGAGKVSFCFGSFDAISLDTGFKNDDSIPAPPLETSQSVEETVEQASSLENVFPTAAEGDCNNHPQSPEDVRETSSPGEQHDVSSTGNQEYAESKPESELLQRSYQYPIIHSSPNYGFGLMPTMMGNQLPPFEGSESQARDMSRIPSFVVPQPFDPASYYAQFYRSPPSDGDGRISPFHATDGATKYVGNVAVLPPHTSQSVPEGRNSVVMSTAGQNTFVTQQQAGLMPSSIAVTQQPVPVFRQPYGIPIPHYSHNYIPYGPYYSQFFVPPFHQSLGNNAYPHQLQAGSIYPSPPGPSPKYSISQYRDGNSSVNSTSVGVASSYGSTAGNSTTNEDLSAQQQFKETNVYIAGQQQSEGSAVWHTPPGREMPGVQQATSFYNIPSHGFSQHQHGPFTGIYHTPQAISATQTMGSAIDIADPTPNMYQQPQHAQVAWPNNNY